MGGGAGAYVQGTHARTRKNLEQFRLSILAVQVEKSGSPRARVDFYGKRSCHSIYLMIYASHIDFFSFLNYDFVL